MEKYKTQEADLECRLIIEQRLCCEEFNFNVLCAVFVTELHENV